MNIAIGIGTLLLGGWVLNTPTNNEDQYNSTPAPKSQSTQSPSAKSALPPGARSLRGLDDETNNNAPQRRGDRESSQNQPSATPRTDDQPKRQAQPKWILPTPPTDPGVPRAGGSFALPTPPTGVGRDADYRDPTNEANPTGSPVVPNIPEVPTSRKFAPPRTASSPTYYEESTFYRNNSTSSSYPGFAMPVAPTKPFASAKPFASGVSPYMGLFRNDTAGGTIDNYSTLVRPALDQRSMNQKYDLDIYGLERNARLQNRALEQMGRYNQGQRAPQSISTPQFYRSFGGYYPDMNPTQSGYGQ
jgi:hypothetical protein